MADILDRRYHGDMRHVLLTMLLAGSASAADVRPNVLLILADDLGCTTVGAFGGKVLGATPNVDRLAAQGVRFTDMHSPSAVCTPTRYGILTGRYC